MQPLIRLHARAFGALETHVAPALLPTLARLLFVAALLPYYWLSGLTKIGSGPFSPDPGAYVQILPRAFAAAGYDPSALGPLATALVLAGTWTEFLLPVLIAAGLLTRLSALGMIGFVLVQSWVDVVGHGVPTGAAFDRHPDGLVDVRAFWLLPLVVLVLKGAGPLSLDAVLARRQGTSAALTPASQPR